MESSHEIFLLGHLHTRVISEDRLVHVYVEMPTVRVSLLTVLLLNRPRGTSYYDIRRHSESLVDLDDPRQQVWRSCDKALRRSRREDLQW